MPWRYGRWRGTNTGPISFNNVFLADVFGNVVDKFAQGNPKSLYVTLGESCPEQRR